MHDFADKAAPAIGMVAREGKGAVGRATGIARLERDCGPSTPGDAI